MRATRIIVILLIGVLLMLGSCASQTNVPILTLPAPETNIPPPTAMAPGVIPTPAPTTPDPAEIPVPGPNEVWIQGGEFRPSVITVPVGATVTWIAKDNDTEHDVDSDTGLFFRSLALGGTFSYTFTERGTFTYSCGCNPPMGGTVIVE